MQLLPWLIFLPVIGGVVSWLSERAGAGNLRWIALVTTGLTLLLAIMLWLQGSYTQINAQGLTQWQAETVWSWIPRFGISFHLALDGLSILMVALTALMGCVAVVASWQEQYEKTGLFHLCLMLTIAGVMGVFTAIDLFLFFFFWEMMLIPMYFMILIWGYPASSEQVRFAGATKFFIYTQASGLIMLAAILALAFFNYQHTHIWSFDYDVLLKFAVSGVLSSKVLWLLMLGFFTAFAVKMPIVPLHGWLADAHEQAPTAGSIDITGLLMKTAAYGLLRFCLTLFPEASASFAPVAMTLGLIGIFYGAWLAFVQTDIKRLIAYTSVSHMGLVTIAIFSGSVLAYQGAVMQMIAHGISAAGLFIISSILYQRLQTRDMRQMGGLWSRLRYLPALSLFFAVATLGMPGTGNFIGEFLMLFGSFAAVPVVTSVAAFGMVFASIYALYFMQRTYYGQPLSEVPLLKLSLREFWVLFLLAVLLVILGIFPQWILQTSQPAMESIQQWMDAVLYVSSSITTG